MALESVVKIAVSQSPKTTIDLDAAPVHIQPILGVLFSLA
jgi:hypothetical protein